MNIFFLMANDGGEGVELVTSPLDAGDILDGTCVALFFKAVFGALVRTGFPWV